MRPEKRIKVMSTITLVTGGGRSGKSSHALALAAPYEKKVFIATAMPFDDEMADRIRRHKEERDPSYTTIEEPFDLAGAVSGLENADAGVAVIDCLSVWLGNCMHHQESIVDVIVEAFLDSLESAPCDLIIVTNEVGMGIIPDNQLARTYRDLLGSLNQQIARRAEQVVLLVAGIPVKIK
jgi:adenosylcobinamide kinase/adenosylcobinamide-phosphate guanylyltransferase